MRHFAKFQTATTSRIFPTLRIFHPKSLSFSIIFSQNHHFPLFSVHFWSDRLNFWTFYWYLWLLLYFLQLVGNVSLATLIAVSKAYQDRDKTDQLAAKVDKVMKVQQERAQSRHIVSAYKVRIWFYRIYYIIDNKRISIPYSQHIEVVKES